MQVILYKQISSSLVDACIIYRGNRIGATLLYFGGGTKPMATLAAWRV